MNKVSLEPIDGLVPASYNPRKADPERLEMVKLSLRKLGWLLPVYAAAGGELLSGHQRTHVARELGYKRVPVVRLADMPDHVRKAVNILFNRSTNDMDLTDTDRSISKRLREEEVLALAEGLPDHPLDRFPCMEAKPVPTVELTKANLGRWILYARNVAKTLNHHGVVMPCVVTPNLRVVNGLGRVQRAAEAKEPEVWCVTISEAHARFADAMLNLLSMDFDIHGRYADLLRYNSFRRPRGKRDYLGRAFTFPLLGKKPSKTFDVTKPADRKRWVERFGGAVLDFGAGLCDETRILRSVGVDCTPFEPFLLTGGEIDREAARALTLKFLERVADGTRWQSIFLSAILNSVPFLEDRLHVLTILAALAYPDGTVYATSASTDQAGFESIERGGYLNENDSNRLQFRLDYEPRVTLADISATPKVQKYHTREEWRRLWLQSFREVKVSESINNVEAIASRPRPVNRGKLGAALEFEFNLPYPDGKRMDLVDEAKAAFRARLGLF